MIAGEGVGSLLCPNRVGGHCSGSHLSAPQACAHWAFLPNDTSSQLCLPVAMENSALWNLWGLIEPFWVPTFCGPLSRLRALPGHGQLPWLPLGTQSGRAASAPLECISTLGLLGTALLFSKTASPPKIPG